MPVSTAPGIFWKSKFWKYLPSEKLEGVLSTCFQTLRSLGFSETTAKRIAAESPRWLQSSVESAKKLEGQRKFTVYRGFSDETRSIKYDPSYVGADKEQWVGCKKHCVRICDNDRRCERGGVLVPKNKTYLTPSYVIEYELPESVFFVQDGSEDLPKRMRAQDDDWAWLSRKNIPDERAYIKRVSLVKQSLGSFVYGRGLESVRHDGLPYEAVFSEEGAPHLPVFGNRRPAQFIACRKGSRPSDASLGRLKCSSCCIARSVHFVYKFNVSSRSSCYPPPRIEKPMHGTGVLP